MKKLISLLLVLSLCLSALLPAYATGSTTSTIDSQIYDTICDLLYKALAQSSYAGILNDNHTTLYLCNPINPCRLVEGELSVNTDIEYYLIKADSEYIACVTVCYVDGAFSSASFGTDISSALNHNNIEDNSFALVGHDGALHIKFENITLRWDSVAQTNTTETSLSANDASSLSSIQACTCELSIISTACALPIDLTQIKTPRLSANINVPIISQGSNNILCWAACVVSVGRYYTGNSYSSITPADVSYWTLGKLDTGTADEVQFALLNMYGIQTDLYTGQMPYNTIINYLMGSVPLIVGFNHPYLIAGHMTVVCGFSYSSGATITYYMMDPLEPTLRTVTASTSGPVSIDTYATYPRTWSQTVYKRS